MLRHAVSADLSSYLASISVKLLIASTHVPQQARNLVLQAEELSLTI